MPINLTKGQKVDLTKGNPGLKKIMVGLGWDVNAFDSGADFDLDAAAFMLGENGKCPTEKEFIFYGNLTHESESVVHMGDNLTGAGDGDDEQIVIDLANLPAEYDRIVGEADGEAQKIVSKARTDMEQEREQALKEVKTEIGDLIALAVDKVAGTKASAESDKELIDQFLSDVDADDK